MQRSWAHQSEHKAEEPNKLRSLLPTAYTSSVGRIFGIVVKRSAALLVGRSKAPAGKFPVSRDLKSRGRTQNNVTDNAPARWEMRLDCSDALILFVE